MEPKQSLRNHLVYLLGGGGAHIPLLEVITSYPKDKRGELVDGAPYTAWQLLEHLRIAQWDILEFSRDAGHVSPEFPDGYWPETTVPPTEQAWEESVEQVRSDLREMMDLVADPAKDLHANIPHGSGQTLLREALLVADHNAYHLGQLVLLRRISVTR